MGNCVTKHGGARNGYSGGDNQLQKLLPEKIQDKGFVIDGIAMQEGGTQKVSEFAGQTREAYTGHHGETESKVFIKQVEPKAINAVRREIKLLMRLPDHPHIQGKPLAHARGDDGTLWVVYPFLDGVELFEKIGDEHGEWSEEMLAKMMQPIFDAVRHIHANEMAHRDIKPQNLMVLSPSESDETEKVVLIDFGLATGIGEEESTFAREQTQGVGSRSWAPENQLTTATYDPKKADVFACGRVLSAMLFGGVAVDPVRLGADGIPLQRYRKFEMSPALHEVLTNMLHFDEERRWSMSTCLKAKWFSDMSGQAKYKIADLTENVNTFVMKATHATKAGDWHMLDKTGHEYPSTVKNFQNGFLWENPIPVDDVQVQDPDIKVIAKAMGMMFYEGRPDKLFVYIHIGAAEMAALKNQFPNAAFTQQDFESLASNPTDFQFPEQRRCSQPDILEFTITMALTRSTLFCPYQYKKTGLFARELKGGEHIIEDVPASEHPEFVFDAPWKVQVNGEEVPAMQLLCEGDSLALRGPSSNLPNGEVYRSEAACFSAGDACKYIKASDTAYDIGILFPEKVPKREWRGCC